MLDAQRSYYAAQQTLVNTKLTAAQNIVATYQAIGGDALLEGRRSASAARRCGTAERRAIGECRPD